ADGIELERTIVVGGDDGDRCGRDRFGQRTIREMRQALEDREIRQRRENAASHDDLLAADLVRQRAEYDEERRADHERRGDDQIRRLRIDLQDLLEEEQGVELSAV